MALHNYWWEKYTNELELQNGFNQNVLNYDNKIEYSKGEGLEHGFMDINGNVVQIPF